MELSINWALVEQAGTYAIAILFVWAAWDLTIGTLWRWHKAQRMPRAIAAHARRQLAELDRQEGYRGKR